MSLGLAGVWLLVALVVQLGFAGQLRSAEHRLLAAARFAIEHPEVKVHPRLLPVARSVLPSFESNEMFDFLRRRRAEPGGPQDQFDGMAATALATADAHPQRALAVVPAAPAPAAFVTHAFVHAGWLHLGLCLLLLLLVGPLLERLWGRRVFGLALCAWTPLAAGAFFLAHMGADRGLIGGFSLVTGGVAALAARFRAEELDFLAWLSPFARAQLVAPAWWIVPAWGLGAAALSWSVPGGLPGLDPAVGWSAVAAAALLGAGAAWAIQRSGWEERFGSPVTEPVDAAARDAFRFERVRSALKRGDREAAMSLLELQVQRSPGHRDAVTLWFSLCVERGEPARAAGALAHLLREELRRGAEAVALAQWRELVTHVPRIEVDTGTWIRLAAVAHREGAAEDAERLLRAVVEAKPAPAVAAQAALLAVEAAPELALPAARRALAGDGLPPDHVSELEALVARLAPEPAEPPAEEKPAPPASVFYEESDRSAFGAADDLSALEDFPDGVVREALPLAVGEAGLSVRLSGDETQEIAFARMRGVAMVGVRGLGPRPVVLVDLLLDGGGARALSVLRLRSDRFDPRRLVEGESDPLEALRRFVARLFSAGGGLPLPDPEAAVGCPVRVYADLATYEAEVLRPAAPKLA